MGLTCNWNFQRGGGIQTNKPSVGGVWEISGTTQYKLHVHVYMSSQTLLQLSIILDLQSKVEFWWMCKCTYWL